MEEAEHEDKEPVTAGEAAAGEPAKGARRGPVVALEAWDAGWAGAVEPERPLTPAAGWEGRSRNGPGGAEEEVFGPRLRAAGCPAAYREALVAWWSRWSSPSQWWFWWWCCWRGAAHHLRPDRSHRRQPPRPRQYRARRTYVRVGFELLGEEDRRDRRSE